MFKPKKANKDQDRTLEKKARPLPIKVQQALSQRKATFRLALSPTDPVITIAHPYVNYVVEESVISAHHMGRIDDELLQMQWRETKLKLEYEKSRSRLGDLAASLKDILEHREPIAKPLIRYIKQNLSLHEIIERYTPLISTERGWEAACPFIGHLGTGRLLLEWTTFSCAGCGISKGDAIEFVRRAENLPFPEAVRRLRREALEKITKEVML